MLVFKLIAKSELARNLGAEILEHFILVFIAKIISCKPLTLNPLTLLTAGQTQNKNDSLY